MIAHLGILFLVLVAVAAAVVWQLRDILVLYYEDKYNINIEREYDDETLDTYSEDSGCRADDSGYRDNGGMLEEAG
jgi:hypothetical protein